MPRLTRPTAERAAWSAPRIKRAVAGRALTPPMIRLTVALAARSARYRRPAVAAAYQAFVAARPRRVPPRARTAAPSRTHAAANSNAGIVETRPRPVAEEAPRTFAAAPRTVRSLTMGSCAAVARAVGMNCLRANAAAQAVAGSPAQHAQAWTALPPCKWLGN